MAMRRVESWKYFIDPKDWKEALRVFPNQPWRFYIQPRGEYPRGSWGFFNRASTWLRQESDRYPYPFIPSKALNIETLTSINSLLQFGVIKPWRSIIRNNHLLWVNRYYEFIKPLFSPEAPIFLNDDQVEIKVLGFIPGGSPMLDLVVVQRKLRELNSHKKGLLLKKTFASSAVSLETKISAKSEFWGIVFPYQQKDILENLESILSWYYSECEFIMTHYKPGTLIYKRMVIKLAVKMQRFIDITHFASEASGRTSKLVQDYVCLLFGLNPPKPVFFEYKSRAIENGTYLPLKIAFKMAWQGYERGF